MPRKGRGQSGQSGGAYQNRTDLAAPQSRPQAIQVPTGQPYGERQANVESQQQMPLNQEQPTVSSVDPYQAAIQAAEATPFAPVGLNAPTERPNEPVTAGLSSGPGPGPAALRAGPTLSSLLERVALQSGNVTIQAMLDRARQMGL